MSFPRLWKSLKIKLQTLWRLFFFNHSLFFMEMKSLTFWRSFIWGFSWCKTNVLFFFFFFSWRLKTKTLNFWYKHISVERFYLTFCLLCWFQPLLFFIFISFFYLNYALLRILVAFYLWFQVILVPKGIFTFL